MCESRSRALTPLTDWKNLIFWIPTVDRELRDYSHIPAEDDTDEVKRRKKEQRLEALSKAINSSRQGRMYWATLTDATKSDWTALKANLAEQVSDHDRINRLLLYQTLGRSGASVLEYAAQMDELHNALPENMRKTVPQHIYHVASRLGPSLFTYILGRFGENGQIRDNVGYQDVMRAADRHEQASTAPVSLPLFGPTASVATTTAASQSADLLLRMLPYPPLEPTPAPAPAPAPASAPPASKGTVNSTTAQSQELDLDTRFDKLTQMVRSELGRVTAQIREVKAIRAPPEQLGSPNKRLKSGTCNNCNKAGHWWTECPNELKRSLEAQLVTDDMKARRRRDYLDQSSKKPAAADRRHDQPCDNPRCQHPLITPHEKSDCFHLAGNQSKRLERLNLITKKAGSSHYGPNA